MSASIPEPPYPSSEAAESDPPREHAEEHHRTERPDDYAKQEPKPDRQESDRERKTSYDPDEVGDAAPKAEDDPLRWPVERTVHHE
jgi:hypothetical protein